MPKLVSGRVVNTRTAAPSARGVPVGVGDGHVELGTLGAADPVALHGLDPLGPLEPVEVVEQLVGVVGDAEEPLLEVALLDHGTRPFGRAVGQDLLVGQHGLVDGVPVHGGRPPVGQAGLEQTQEDPLGPALVLGAVAGDLAAPVVDGADAQDRAAELLDALVGELTGVAAGLDGGVLGRQPEAVEAHRRQHGVAVHRAVADVEVAEGVVADVAHVRRTARVRVHAQRVPVGAGVVVVDLVGAVLGPVGLPLLLDHLGVVAVSHRPDIVRGGRRTPCARSRPVPRHRRILRGPRGPVR